MGDGRSWREEEEGGNDKYSTCVSNSQELKFKLKKNKKEQIFEPQPNGIIPEQYLVKEH